MFRATAATLALLLPLSACGAGGDEGSADLDVVASFYPLAWAAERIVGDHASVENLTEGGQEPHDLELTVRQTATLAGASAAFYVEGFQPAVDEALAQAGDVRAVNALDLVADAANETHEDHDHEDHDHSDHGDHDHGDHEHEDHGHSHSDEGDPHFWLDPSQLAAAGAGFAEAMAEVDPEHAEDYRANAAALTEDLEALDREFGEGLAECRTRTVVVSHDAFGRLGSRYDLDLVPIAGLSPDAEPSARQLAQIRDEAQAAQVTTVFAERLASPALAETLADELGVETGILDPLEGLEKDASGDYLDIMRENLDALRTANGCT